MNVEYSDKVKQGGDGFSLVQQATRRLEAVLGKSAATVAARWNSTTDPTGQERYTIRISDGTDNATGMLTPEHLASRNRLEVGLRLLWDDVLRARIDKQLQKAREADGES